MIAARAGPAPAAPARRGRDLGGRGSAGERLRSLAAIGVPTALGAALCLYEITTRSLGFDEFASVTIAAAHGGALGSAIAHDGGNMAGYYVLLHVLIGALGNSALVVRLPSALAGAATVAIVGLLAGRLFGRQCAFVSGLLSAVSLPLVFWAQDARGYAPMVALASSSFLALVVLVDRDSSRRARRWAWIAYVVLTTLAVYCSFVAVLVVPAQLVTLLWHRRPLRRVASALAVCALACAPLVVLAVQRGSGQLFWVSRPSIAGATGVLETLTSSALAPSFRVTSTAAILLGLTGAILIAVAAAIGRGLSRRAEDWPEWGQTLVLAWLVVPVALAGLESLVGQPIFLPRNLLMSMPAVALLLGWGISDRRVPRPVAWSLLAGVLALRVLQLIPSYGVSPEDWRAASAHVLARSHPGDCIAFYPSDGRMAFQYYVGTGTIRTSRAPLSVLPSLPWGEVRPYVEDYVIPSRSQLSGLPGRCPRLWLVSSHSGQPDGPRRSRANHARYLELLSTLTGEYGDRDTASFGYASPVRVELLAR
ncbi:MAG: glycosyltransferase family 39 protein [Solirubrobacteraceae bacterium]